MGVIAQPLSQQTRIKKKAGILLHPRVYLEAQPRFLHDGFFTGWSMQHFAWCTVAVAVLHYDGFDLTMFIRTHNPPSKIVNVVNGGVGGDQDNGAEPVHTHMFESRVKLSPAVEYTPGFWLRLREERGYCPLQFISGATIRCVLCQVIHLYFPGSSPRIVIAKKLSCNCHGNFVSL